VERWSPDAAIGAIREQGLAFTVTLCTKTVYNMIDRGDFLNLTNKNLPVKKDGKKRPYKRIRKKALHNLKGRSIEERPERVQNREEYGHWEMDCVEGSKRACLLVLTERKTRLELLFKLAEKTQDNVIAVIDKLERRYKRQFSEAFKTITMDNGGEFLDMKRLETSSISEKRKRTLTYYAHPYSAWERGSNENANKLVRRFIPKGTDIGKYTNADIKRIEHWMNNYPRRMFGYKTANDMAI
jgi:IS30 family transposase